MIDYAPDFSLDNVSPHSVAGIVKLWVRELPEPLLTFVLYDDMVRCTRNEDWAGLEQLEAGLPEPNRTIFRYLCTFLAEVSMKSDVNKMTPSNLAIVFAPNLIRPAVETFEAIARDTPVTIATIKHFVEVALNQLAPSVSSEYPTATMSKDDTPLPENWTVYLDETTGAPFFYNVVTNESRWDRPTSADATTPRPSTPTSTAPSPASPPSVSEHLRKGSTSAVPLAPATPNHQLTHRLSSSVAGGTLPPDWVEFRDDATGVPYYYNETSKECVWVRPSVHNPLASLTFDDLEFAHAVNGKWTQGSAGGCFPAVTWFQNAQWIVHLAADGPARFRVCLGACAPSPIGVHVVAVESGRTVDDGRLLMIPSEERLLAIGPFSDDEPASDATPRQATTDIRVVGPCSLMIVPSTNTAGVLGDFVMSVSCSVPISITQVADDGSAWKSVSVRGAWTSSTAGGCYPNFSSWRTNPQFIMRPANPSIPVRVLVHLKRDSVADDDSAIGIYVVSNNGPAQEKLGVCDGDVLARSEFVTSSDTVVEASIPSAGSSGSVVAVADGDVKNVIAIPCTYEPGIIDGFTLTVFADQQLEVDLIPDARRWCSTPFITSTWAAGNSGGCRNFDTWQKNPTFVLSCPNATHHGSASWQAMCIISQPDPDCILPIGFYVTDTNGKTRCKGTFSLAPEVFGQMVFKREEAPYTLYACTFNPGLEGVFKVQVFSQSPCTLVESGGAGAKQQQRAASPQQL